MSYFLGASSFDAGRGGIARVARMTARAMVEAGLDVRTAALLDDTPQTFGVHELETAGGSRLRFAVSCHKAAMACDHFLYDAVGPARAHPGLPGLNRPYGVWIHGVEVWNSLRPGRAAALKGAEYVLVNSHFTLAKFNQLHWPLANAHVVQLSTEDDAVGPFAEMPDRQYPPSLLILGRIDADESYKGHEELIAAWPTVVAEIPEARLLIAGGGSGLETIRALAETSPVQDQIEVLGFVPNDDLPTLWDRVGAFAMPSRGEGFGIVYAEAMQRGLPVIASVHDAGSEVNADGETGFNVNLDEAGALEAAIIDLLKDPSRTAEFGRRAYERWRTHFTYSAFRDRLMAAGVF